MVPRDLIGAVKPRALQVWCCLHQWSDADERKTTPTHARIAGEIGCSVDAVKRAIVELERSGRLQKLSGKNQGKGNEYRLILTRRNVEGRAKMRDRSGENARPHIKEVPRSFNQEPPIAPQRGAEVDDSSWFDFCRLYPKQKPPRKDRFHLARPLWDDLGPEQRAAALVAVEVLAKIHAVAPEERQQMTPQAHKWLREQRWNYNPNDVETHYHVAGLLRELKIEARRKAENEARRKEWAEMEAQARKEKTA
jgi:hypothetical protein